MPIWLIEFFGAGKLDRAFVLILLMTAPLWIGMIAFPSARWVGALARPWVAPPLYALVLVALIWKAWAASLTPEPLTQLGYDDARAFARHPMAFLALFCNLQVLNLFVGTVIHAKAARCGLRAPVELSLCWLFGALALPVFLLRLLWNRQTLQ